MSRAVCVVEVEGVCSAPDASACSLEDSRRQNLFTFVHPMLPIDQRTMGIAGALLLLRRTATFIYERDQGWA
jgi:hypothetical protein